MIEEIIRRKARAEKLFEVIRKTQMTLAHLEFVIRLASLHVPTSKRYQEAKERIEEVFRLLGGLETELGLEIDDAQHKIYKFHRALRERLCQADNKPRIFLPADLPEHALILFGDKLFSKDELPLDENTELIGVHEREKERATFFVPIPHEE